MKYIWPYGNETIVKHLNESELEEIWLHVCFKSCVSYGNTLVNFHDDFLNKLPYEGKRPFDRIRGLGTVSPQFLDILYGSHLGFANRFHRMILDSLFYLGGHLSSSNLTALEEIAGSSPLVGRQFYLRTRPSWDPLVPQMIILNKQKRDELRNLGFYIPPRFDRLSYRFAEIMYLKHVQQRGIH